MNPNMSIYRRLNPRLLVQAGMGLGLLHWANICLIYISNNGNPFAKDSDFFHLQCFRRKLERKLQVSSLPLYQSKQFAIVRHVLIGKIVANSVQLYFTATANSKQQLLLTITTFLIKPDYCSTQTHTNTLTHTTAVCSISGSQDPKS